MHLRKWNLQIGWRSARRTAVSYPKRLLAIKEYSTTTLALGWMLRSHMASTIFVMKSRILRKDQLQIS